MAGHTDLSKDVDIDIAGLFLNIWKKKWIILILSLLAGAGTFAALSSIAPRYRATAQLIIEPRESQFTRVTNQNGGVIASEFDTAAVLSQVQIILSDTIALNTIRDLKLASIPEFRKENQASLVKDLLILAGIKKQTPELTPEETARKNDEYVLKTFKSRLNAYSIENSRVIELSFWANDPKLVKTITNYVADQYLLLQRESKLETGANATKFLEVEIGKLRKKVRSAEAKVAEFRASSDILLGNNNALLATQQLSEVSTELSRVKAQRSAAQAKIETIRSTINVGASLEAIPEVVASPLIQRLRERQVQLRAQISELSVTLLPSHPRLKALKSQQSDFENQIRREARGILKSLENNLDILRSQEASLVKELTRLKAESARVGEAEVELRALERDAVSERELLQAYMSKFREAAGRQSNKYLPVNAQIISAAHQPADSYFPKTIPYTIVGALVTAILSMVGVLVVSLLGGKAFKPVEGSNLPVENSFTVNTANQVPTPGHSVQNINSGYVEHTQENPPVRNAEIPVAPRFEEKREMAFQQLGSVAMVADEARNQNTMAGKAEPLANLPETVPPSPIEISEINKADISTTHTPLEETRPVKSALDANPEVEKKSPVENKGIDLSLVSEGLLGMGKTRIAVISPEGDSGSITTWMLARKLAADAKYVVVMDMTGSGVTTNHMLGSVTAPGVGDYLAGSLEMHEVIHEDQQSKVNVVGVGNFVPQEAQVTQDRLRALVETLSDSYDYLIIDCGDANIQGLAQVANINTVVVVSAEDGEKARALENKLLSKGYPETICLYPNENETREYSRLVA